jgi:hypothetical protein
VSAPTCSVATPRRVGFLGAVLVVEVDATFLYRNHQQAWVAVPPATPAGANHQILVIELGLTLRFQRDASRLAKPNVLIEPAADRTLSLYAIGDDACRIGSGSDPDQRQAGTQTEHQTAQLTHWLIHWLCEKITTDMDERTLRELVGDGSFDEIN